MVDAVENFFITAVLVTHDGATWLPKVVAALSSQTRRVDRIIAVDTGSIDSSVKLLQAAGITVIPADRELGYGDAVEIALEHAPLGSSQELIDSEWIWLIHDDCAPAQDALEIMLGELIDRPQVVIAGPKLLGWYDRDHLLEAGISIAINGARWTGLENREQDQGQQNFTREVLSVSTAAMLVKRSAFTELGGLDPNLDLFRDDVDLGWRAHVAGFSAICVGAATAYHAQASASERRQVDVSEAFLHRPLLLDRRNAAYVLLVNSSWWMLPWVSVQLLGTSVIRALFDLVAKLPGYAGDELAAIGLLLLHPNELIVARRKRRKKRLLSPRVVARFIPPRGSQIRAGIDRVTSVFFKSVDERRNDGAEFDSLPQEAASMNSFTDLGTLGEDFDEVDLSAPIKASFIRSIIRKPEVFTLLLILFVALIAGRSRFGQLGGGALSLVPTQARDLIANYFSPWHPVGMGSHLAEPPWLAILAVASVLTLGHFSLFIGALFMLAAPLAFYIFTKTLKRIGISSNFATAGALLYVANPLLWTSLNQGRIGTVVLYLLLPALLLVNPIARSLSGQSWRRIFATSLLIALLGSFSPLLFTTWLCGQLLLLGVELFAQRGNYRKVPLFDLLESDLFKPVGRRVVLLVMPLGLLLPWSAAFIVHPTQWLLAPGAPLASDTNHSTVLLNPGGLGASALWVISPLVISLLCIAASKSLHKLALVLAVIYSAIVLLARLHVFGHGGTANIWTGDLILLLSLFVIPALVQQGIAIIPTLRATKFGFTHIATGVAIALLSFGIGGQLVWAMTAGSQSLVRANPTPLTPAFVGAIAATPTRPKTVVISVSGSTTKYFVSRGSEISLGDADVAAPLPDTLNQTIADLLSGSGLTSAKTFAAFGIQYLFVTAPVPPTLASSIDGTGGFVRVSATTQGVMWKVLATAPRILFTPTSGKPIPVTSAISGASGDLTGPGIINVGESYDSHWKLLLNGQSLAVSTSAAGTPQFVVPQAGKAVLTYDGTAHRALISFQLLALLFSIVMALPYGRRRVEVPLEELV